MKRIRIDAEGDATLEELDDTAERQDNGQEPSQEPETTKPSNKKVCMLQTQTLSFAFSIFLMIYPLANENDGTMSWSTYRACLG